MSSVGLPSGGSSRLADTLGSWWVVPAAASASAVAGVAVATGNLLLLLPVALVAASAFLPLLQTQFAKDWALPLWLSAGPALYPFVRFPFGNGSIATLDRLLIIGLAVAWFPGVAAGSRGASRASKRFTSAWTLLTLVLFMRVILDGLGSFSSVTIWVDAFVIPLLAFLLVRVYAEQGGSVDRILVSLGVGGAIAGAIGIAERIAGFSLASWSGGVVRFDFDSNIIRFAGPYNVPEVYFCVLIVAFAATLCWGARNNWRRPGVLLALGALQLIGVWLTYFRAGFIAVIVVGIGIAAIRRGRSLRTLLVAVALAVPIYLTINYLQAVDATFAGRLGNTKNSLSRLAAYEQGVIIMKSSPVIGVGIQKFEDTASQLAPIWVNGVKNVNHPHNSLVEIGAEAGVPAALVLFATFVFAMLLCRSLWRRSHGWRDEMLALGCGLALIGYGFVSLTLAMIEYGTPTQFLMAFLALAAARNDHLSIRGSRWKALGARDD